MDTFTDQLCSAGTRPHQMELPSEDREHLLQLVRQARFEPEKAFFKLLQHYADEPRRTLAQIFFQTLST